MSREMHTSLADAGSELVERLGVCAADVEVRGRQHGAIGDVARLVDEALDSEGCDAALIDVLTYLETRHGFEWDFEGTVRWREREWKYKSFEKQLTRARQRRRGQDSRSDK